MSEQDFPGEFARMLGQRDPEPDPEPKPDDEPPADTVTVADLFRVPSIVAKREADRRLLESMHKPYESDEPA
jgi:hypothetical protein